MIVPDVPLSVGEERFKFLGFCNVQIIARVAYYEML